MKTLDVARAHCAKLRTVSWLKKLSVAMLVVTVLMSGCREDETSVEPTDNPPKNKSAQVKAKKERKVRLNDRHAKSSPVQEGKEERPSLMKVEIGRRIDTSNETSLNSLGVYKLEVLGDDEFLYFKPLKTFRQFDKYLMVVKHNTGRVIKICASCKVSKKLEDVKNEVAYLVSLLKQKYGVPGDRHVQVDHRGGSHLYDEWIYTVDIDQRYSFTVSRKYTSPGPGWEISIRLTDKIPDMNEADLDAL